MAETKQRLTPTGNPQLTWGPPPRQSSKILKGSLVAISIGVGAIGALSSFVPVLGQIAGAPLLGIAHVADRLKNGVEESDEHKYRATYYSAQIFRTLGISAKPGRTATVKEFKLAADMNPELAKLYQAPIKVKEKENRSSMFINGGIAAAGMLIPGGGTVAAVGEAGKLALEATHAANVAKGGLHAAKHMLGAMAGGAIANAISGDIVDPQALLESIDQSIAEVRAQGIDTHNAISPNLIFLLRVSQDPEFAEAIKKDFGEGKRGFHQMNEADQAKVMRAYPALTRAVTSEASALGMGILQAPTLGAAKPNLNSSALQYAAGARAGSFVSRLNAQRAAAPIVGQSV